MSERAPRGGGNDRAAAARRNVRAPKARRPRAGTAGAKTQSLRRLPALDVDRIVVMRVVLVAIVLAFLYLVVWIGARAFGSGAKQATRIDRVIIDATDPQPPAPAPGTEPGTRRRTPP